MYVPPPVWTVGRGLVLETSREVKGVDVVGRLEDLCCKIGDARRKWSHM